MDLLGISSREAEMMVYQFQAVQIGAEFFSKKETGDEMNVTVNDDNNNGEPHQEKKQNVDVAKHDNEVNRKPKRKSTDRLWSRQNHSQFQFHKYICTQPRCRNSWCKVSRGETLFCFKCNTPTKPFMNRNAIVGMQYFGYFVCPNRACFLREWESGYAFLGEWQECHRCGCRVYPYELRKYPRGSSWY